MEIIKKNSKRKIFSEINVTPFVDVMMVLLVIFMITAPMLDQGIQINLPKAKGGQMDKDEEPVVLYIKNDKSLLIDNYVIPPETLSSRLKFIFQKRNKKEIFVKADEGLSYGFVAKTISDIKEAGITKIGLVTASPQDKDADKPK